MAESAETFPSGSCPPLPPTTIDRRPSPFRRYPSAVKRLRSGLAGKVVSASFRRLLRRGGTLGTPEAPGQERIAALSRAWERLEQTADGLGS